MKNMTNSSTLGISAGSSPQPQCTINLKLRMNTKPRPPITLLLLSAFLLAWAGTAAATDYFVEQVTVLLSSLPPLSAADTITVRSNGLFWVDGDATIGKLTIGDANTTGQVLFDNTPRTLSVNINTSPAQPGDVLFGAAGGVLNMAYLSPVIPHKLKVQGAFVSAGGTSGVFSAGNGTIEYSRNGAQTVTARIGGSGAVIQYKHLTLSSAASVSGTAIKTFAAGVTVQGNLTNAERAVITGSPVTYGLLATLTYNGTMAQTTTPVEWPASPTVLNVPVNIINPSGVTLDSDKTIGAVGTYSLNLLTGNLYDNGKTLTVLGNVNTAGGTTLQGAGKLVLGGSSAQVLFGQGTYGNVTLNNPAGASLAIFNPTFNPFDPYTINGRLILSNGKLKLPNGTSHSAALLTYGGVDKPVLPPTPFRTYGALASGATVMDDTVFEPTFTGQLTVFVKPTPTVSVNLNPASITFGENPPVHVTGNVIPPAGPPNFTLYGNGAAVPGETISNVVVQSSGFPIQIQLAAVTASGNDRPYALDLNTTLFPLDIIPYTVTSSYYGGINLAPAAVPGTAPLTVGPKQIIVTPNNVAKVYSKNPLTDPPLTYTYTPALLPGDFFSGALHRTPGEDVGGYAIDQGTLALNANYTIAFITGKALTIVQKPIALTVDNQSKIYGTADPPLTYSFSPTLIFPDTFSGALTRDGAGTLPGENVGAYAIRVGTLIAGGNGGANYLLTLSPATLTINKKNITVTFDNKAKTYGDPDPPFTFPPPGLIPGDAFTGTPTRDPGELVANSPYTILPGVPPSGLSLGAAAGNYNLTYTTSGKLTIGKKPVSVAALSPSKFYGAPVPALVGYSGFLPGKTAPDSPNTTTPAPVATPCSLPGLYPFTVNNDASDANYSFNNAAPAGGTLTNNPAPLTITADNKTKIGDNAVFNPANFTVTYQVPTLPPNTFVCGDTVGGAPPNNVFTPGGLLAFLGNATTNTYPGVYQIIPTGLTSSKYAITYVPGWLAITAPPSTTAVGGPIIWYGTPGPAIDSITNLTWMINQANGAAGGNPGWSLLYITNSLSINATPANPFRIDLVTLNPFANNAAGLMAKFDPTRPYSWEIVRTGTGISGFAANVFSLNWQGANLFANPIFGGQFSVRQSGNSIMLDFNPVGPIAGIPAPVPIPPGYTVGTTGDPASLLGWEVTHDVDTLYLQPSATTITPQDTVTINLNVANLKQPIIGVDAYINFDSRFFNAGPGQVGVVAGGGVWDTLIYKTWNVGGDLDTVIAVNLSNVGGTSANGTVARITLTPTRNATGKSRVVFRHDGDYKVGTTDPLTTDLVAADSSVVLPARVMTDEIGIVSDTTGPTIGTITATQVQPHVGSVIVKNGAAQTVRTSGGVSPATASGPVVITIDATDLLPAGGVGLSGAPSLVLSNLCGCVPIVSVPNTAIPPGLAGTFTYQWNVPSASADGTWSAYITAGDTVSCPTCTPAQTTNTTTVPNAFTLVVNTTEVTGVVELQSFKGTNRVVTFKAGDLNPATAIKQWDINLNFISGLILNAGAFQNRSNLAVRMAAPPPADPLSTYLRYGAVLNLPTLAGTLVNPATTANTTSNVTVYIHALLWGYITNLPPVASALSAPTFARSVDAYIMGRLSPATIVALGAYQSANPAGKLALTPSVTLALLNDFNTIVLGGSIYEAVRFASVTPSATTLALLALPTPTPDQLVALNRNLLHDAYPDYWMGQLRPQTAQRLTQYLGGADPVLEQYLLGDFDTLTRSPAMWPAPVTVPYDQALYNQVVFLGVTLQPATLQLLYLYPTGAGRPTDQRTLLNQHLLEDAYVGLYQRPPLSPETVTAVLAFDALNPATFPAFEGGMMTDLNALINGGSIYTLARFQPWVGAIDPAGELYYLLTHHPLSAAQQVRENRLLLELGYDAELSKSVLAPYRLVAVPPGTTEVSAKTAWSLQARRSFSAAINNTANFVNDGVPGWTGGSDYYLRGGDLNGDNTVSLSDYNILRINFGGTAGGPADINGDGFVNILDYSLLQVNWAKNGDPNVQ
jgi:hypothetical protein